jgi:predicted molibdopterin-dependent oxidoreductase YjgC
VALKFPEAFYHLTLRGTRQEGIGEKCELRLTAKVRLCIFNVDTSWRSADAVRVRKNSLAVRIPKPLAEDVEVKEGTVLNLAVSEGRRYAGSEKKAIPQAASREGE